MTRPGKTILAIFENLSFSLHESLIFAPLFLGFGTFNI